MGSRIGLILLPALGLALTACNETGPGGPDSGLLDAGGTACSAANPCPNNLVCDTGTGQCECASGAPPCGTMCCSNNFTCAGSPVGCVCQLTYCGAECTNTVNDPKNCGGCGKACHLGVTCSNYACNDPVPDSGPIPDSGTATDGGPPGLHDPCDASASPDPCLKFGLFCNPGSTSTCELPTMFLTCDPAVGCATGLDCDTFTKPDTSKLTFCAIPCADDRDCAYLGQSCQNVLGIQICYIAFCGPGSLPDGGNNGLRYYDPCVMVPSFRPGTCLPYGQGNQVYGVCRESGSVVQNEPCSDLRVDAGNPGILCDYNLQCQVINSTQGDGGSTSTSLCAPYCDLTGISASEACGAGSTCFTPGGELFGFCLQDCGGGVTCPPPLYCGVIGSTPRNECLPTLPDAG